MITIGQQVNVIRLKKNVTLKELAEKSGVSEWTMCSWIYQGHTPTVDLLICVADVLNVSLDELVGRKVKNEAD